jgi:folate-binding protein YgfZ
MPSSFFQRYEKARLSCALFHLEDWAIFRLSGAETQDYLHRISTADIKGCGAGEARQTLFLNGDGRMVADCAILCESSESYYPVCPASCKDGLAAQLDRFLFTEKVSVEDVSSAYYMAVMAGPKADNVAAQISMQCGTAGVTCMVYKVSIAPAAQRSLVLVDMSGFQQVRGLIYEEVEAAGGVIADVDLYATFRIEEGLPIFGKDINEKTIPLEANLKRAISFTKGCFPGQEIVARINNLGHPANILVGLTLPETTETLVGRELSVSGKTVGRITSVCFSPALKSSLALGYVKWNFREPGQVVDIAGDEAYKAVVVELPVPGAST